MWSKVVEIDYSPARYLIQSHVGVGFSMVYRRVEGQGVKDLPWMITETLVTHVMAANATANLFLFQMAMLDASVSAWFGKDGPGFEEWKETYMRRTTKRDALTWLT